MVFVRATRYVYDALKSIDYDISLITPAHLDLAAAAIFKRESEVSAYKAVGHMEEFADMLDANGLPVGDLKAGYQREIVRGGELRQKEADVPVNQLPE